MQMHRNDMADQVKIILVEDSEHDLIAFQRAFRNNGTGCDIRHFTRAEDALQWLDTGERYFDLLVSDYRLPGMSGLDFFRQYRAMDIMQPFVIMTGYGSEKFIVDVFREGAVDYLIKDPGQYYLELLPAILGEVARKYRERQTRHQVETALRNSERRLADIIDFLPDATFAIDQEGKVIIWNRMAEEFTGIMSEEMIGKGNYEYSIPFYGERRSLLIDLLFRPSDEIESRYPFIIRDGNTIKGEAYTYHVRRGEGYMFGVAAPLYDSDGNVIGAIETVRDITDRKQIEEGLRESEQKLKSVVNGSPIPQFVIDRDHRVIFWNRALEKLTGIRSEEAIGSVRPWQNRGMDSRPSMAEMLLDGTPERIFELCKGVCSKSRLIPDSYEVTEFFPALGKEGRWVFMTAVTIRDFKGSAIAAMQTMEDVTERKMMEEELLKGQKLESLALLAGGIAHDYNNLLTSIMGNISLAKLLTKPGEKLYDRLDAAEQSSFRARNLTKRLITFARGGAPVRKVIALDRVVRESAELSMSGSKNRCVFNMQEDLWAAEADEGQISQVISNMVINADQSMMDYGTITIRCGNYEHTESEHLPLKRGRYVRIDIEDQGAGIPEECLGKIFDPYYTTRESGKGLGLTLAYSIIMKHDGYIGVRSMPGAGSIFSIYIPAAASLETLQQEGQPPAVVGGGKVLIMDDEEVVRMVLGEMLKHLGYQVDFSVNGNEAINLYDAAARSGKRFDLVIMDLTIPGGMGGKEAVKQLKGLYPDARVIVSSGYSNDPVMSNYREYGFSGVVLKPYQVAELAGTLQEVLAAG